MTGTLDAKVEAFEQLFDLVQIDYTAKDVTIVWTGGIGTDTEMPPALCINEDLAIKFWHAEVTEFYTRHAGAKSLLIWRHKPELWRYSMTLQDMRSTQRLVSPRYTVYSVLAFGEAPKREEEPELAAGLDTTAVRVRRSRPTAGA